EPIDVSPAFVTFGASTDLQTNQLQTVHVVNHLDQPLALSEPISSDKSLKVSINTLNPGKEFDIQIALVPPLTAGSFTIPIAVKTSSASLPVINLTAFVTVQARIKMTPPQITLPPGSLASGIETNVTIENNGSMPLNLSEPESDVPGVKVDLK